MIITIEREKERDRERVCAREKEKRVNTILGVINIKTTSIRNRTGIPILHGE